MRAWPVVLNAAMVGVEVFLLATFGPEPLIVACLIFCSLMFLCTLVMAVSDL